MEKVWEAANEYQTQNNTICFQDMGVAKPIQNANIQPGSPDDFIGC
jgi:hypothetical protein